MRAVSRSALRCSLIVSSKVCGLGGGLICDWTAVSATVSGCGLGAVSQRSWLLRRHGAEVVRAAPAAQAARVRLHSRLRSRGCGCGHGCDLGYGFGFSDCGGLRAHNTVSTCTWHQACARCGSKMLTYLLSTRQDELVVDHSQTGPRSARLRKAEWPTSQPDKQPHRCTILVRGRGHRLCLATSVVPSLAMVSESRPPTACQPARCARQPRTDARLTATRAQQSNTPCTGFNHQTGSGKVVDDFFG